MRTRTAWMVVPMVVLLGLTACSGDDDDSGGPLGSQSAGNEGDDNGGRSGQPGTGGDPSAEPLGTTRARRQADPNDERNIPLRIDVVRLERHGELVELGLVLTNEAEEDSPGSGEPNFEPYSQFGGGPGINARYDISEVGIVDPDVQRIYLPVIDDQDVCRCTTGTGAIGVAPGDSTNLDATIGGLPEDVETVDVHVPGFPPITGVEVG